MIEININEEGVDFSKLAAMVASGERIIINYDGFPPLELSKASAKPAELTKEQAANRLGGLKFSDSMPSTEEWQALDTEVESLFESSLSQSLPTPE